MFKSFYASRGWLLWSYPGAALILLATWYQVQLDVRINEWFGSFYNLVQKSLGSPGSVTLDEYMEHLATFGSVAGTYVTVAVLTDFFVKHYVFRWRAAMTDRYAACWDTVRGVEGASQRVQEDTMRFARLMETLGVSLMRSVMTLVAFLPILWTLSQTVTELPWVGAVGHMLVWVAILFALAGTVLLALVGVKLPGLEFQNQRVEAAFRKELVYGEDDRTRARPASFRALFGDVRRNYFRLFFHYMYFDVARYCYLQFGVLVPYIALGPTLVRGAITLGVMQQIVRAFGRVEGSFQYLVSSWTTIVELISVFKRLRTFERQMADAGMDDMAIQQA